MASMGAQAQTISASTYPMTTLSGVSLEDLSTGATTGVAASSDDGLSGLVNIGFPFRYMGTVYTQLDMSANGFVRLGATITTGTANYSNSLASNQFPALAPYWDDLQTGSNGQVRYKLIGSAPSRKFVVEWQNAVLTGGGSGSTNFQLWISETSGEIQFVYGANCNISSSFSCGINWSSSVYANVVTSTNTVTYGTGVNNSQSTSIASGTSYKFTPNASIAGPSSLSFSNIGLTSMTLNWVASSPQTGVVGYIIYASSDGGTTYNQVGTVTGSATVTANITGLQANTTYLWQVYAYSEGAQSATYADNVQGTNACSMTGTFTIGPSGTYTKLGGAGGALEALANQGVAGPVIFELQAGYVSSVETTLPLVLPNVPCMDATNTVTIRPAAGATALSISGSNTTALFNINGGHHFIIDGRAGGAGASQLSITNTGNGPALRFINEASNNIVRYTTITSASASTTSGAIFFSTTTGANGNDNNTITNSDINGNGVVYNLIYCSGSTTTTATNNSGNIISNNTLHDQFNASNATNGIYLSSGATDWTITGNSLYQTASRTFTSSSTHYGIRVATGNNHTITNNYVGGSSANAGGTAYTLSGVSTAFVGIASSSSTTTANTITGNTVSNISLTSAATTSSLPGVFTGLYVSSGLVSANNNNLNSIAVTTSANGGLITGIGLASGSTGNITINNNTIGGFTMNGSATTGNSFTGISTSGSLTGSFTISGNTVGHASNANSINFATANTAGGNTLMGISCTGTPSAGLTISNNTIANFTSAYNPTTATTSAVIRGIYATGGVVSITGNSIHDLTANANSTGTAESSGVLGIAVTTSNSGANAVTSNTIYSLLNNHPTSANLVTGIFWNVSSGGGLVNRNLIYSLHTPSTIGIVSGISVANLATVQNNMIRLGIDATGASRTNATQYIGINVTSASNIWHNTVYIGGTGVSTAPATATYAFWSTVSTGTSSVLNNIFMNARTSASAGAKHYAIRLNSITGLTINNNVYYAPGAFAGVLGSNNGTDVTNLAAWQAFTTQDGNSKNVDVCLNNPTAGTPNLHLTDCSGAGSPADGAGTATSVTVDFDNETRSGLTPIDIGADAGNYGVIGVNVGLSALVAPAAPTGCYTNAESVIVTLNNYGVNTIDFSVNPVTVNVTTNTGYNSSIVINSGTLAAAGTQNVTMPATIDMTASATYTFSGSATVAGDVNTANDAMPTTSRVYTSLGGTYTVGSGGNYATLKAAVDAWNAAICLTGPVVFSLTDASYTESNEVVINQIPMASATNTLTIKPATGVTATFNGSQVTSLIKINGADYVTIDGSNNGSSSRDLTFINSASTGSVINVASVGGVGNGANHVTIKNLNIKGGSNASGNYGIISSASSGLANSAEDNDYLTIQNNSIQKVYKGIQAYTATTAGVAADNLVITGNSIGSSTSTDYVLNTGIVVSTANAPVISNNTIFNMIHTNGYNTSAIEIADNIVGGSVTGNVIRDIQSSSTSGYGAYGINFSSSTNTSDVTVANNMISGIMTANYSTSSTTWNAFGIRLTGGTNLKIYHNSVNLYGSVANGSSAGISADLVITSSSVTGLDLRNNIFTNTQNFGASGSSAYNIYAAVGTLNGTFNYNNYYGTSGSNTTYRVGYLNSTNYATLANWQTATAQGANSTAFATTFTSPSDLHLVPASNSFLDNTGTNVGVATDIDGDSRSGSTPDVGADEFTAPVVQDVRLTALVAPGNSGCYSATEPVTVTVLNNTNFPLDLSANPVTVSVTATGGYSSSTVINSGIIAANGTQNVTLPATIDLTVAGTYTFNGSATVTGDINTANDALPSTNIVSAAVAVGTVSSSVGSYCQTGGTPTLTLSSYAGGTIQWQESTASNSGPWTNVGTGGLTYTPSAAITQTTYYQAVVTCTASAASVTSNVVTVNLISSSITGTTPGSRCGPGSVQLSATTTPGAQVLWFDAASGGNYVGSGSPFNTPSISATTTYYAGSGVVTPASIQLTPGASTTTAGGSPIYYLYGSKKTQYLILASELQAAQVSPGNISSLGFYISSTNASTFTGFTISMGSTTQTSLSTTNGFQAGLTQVYTTATLTQVSGLNNFVFTTPFVWDGSSNVIIQTCWGNNNTGGSSPTVKYDATSFTSVLYALNDNFDASTACATTTGSSFSTNTSRPQFVFGANTICANPSRQSVVATIVNAPSISASATATTICSGQSTDLSVTSSNDPDYTYTWTPGSLSGANQTVSPTSSTTYTVNAIDNTAGPNAGCTATASVAITVNPTPATPVITPSAVTVCVGGNATLNAVSPVSPLVTNYTFAASTGATLDPMTGATSVIADSDDDTPTSTPANIGFNFTLNGTVYTQYSVSPDGWILLGGTTASNQYTNAVTSTTNTPKLYPYWDDMATGTDGNVKVLVTGTAPNRIFKVQWQVTIPRNTSGASNATFQAWLYEGSNKIEYRYGSMGTPDGSASGGITVNATNYQSLTFGSNSSSTTTPNDANADAPASGTMYTYAPVVIPITWSPATDLNTTTGGTVTTTPTANIVYTATATLGSCTSSSTVAVSLSTLAVSASATDANCNGASTGSVTATATGGTTPYEFSLNGTTWQSSNTFNGLAAGTYTVQVRDANSTQCVVSASPVTVGQPAAIVVSIGGSTDPVCYNTTDGTISASATGGTGSFTYTINGTTINTTGATTGNFTGLAPGSYTVTATDVNNCTGISTTVVLTAPAAPSVTASNNGPVCAGSDATLTATSGYVTYAWTGPGTINNGNTASATAVTPTDGSMYTVTITDANGCQNTATTTVSVIENAAVSVSISVSPSQEICSNSEVTFTATPVNGGSTPTYQWYVNGSPQSGETNSTFVTSTINDQDQVYVEMTSSIGCTTGSPATSNSITMTVTGLIFADASIAADNETVCDGSSVTLTASGNGAGSTPTYDFYVNNNLVQSGSSATYTYVPVNGDEAYVVITSSFDCAIGSPATSSSVFITVNPVPAAPTVSVSGATTFCAGGSVTLTSDYVGGNLWSPNGETTDAITVTTSGTYAVTQTQLGCTSAASTPVVVTVNANPTATITGNNNLCSGTTQTLSAATSTAGSGTITSYQWTLNGTTALGTLATQDITAAGSYTVTITNSNSCSTTSAAFVVTEVSSPTASISASCTTLSPGQTAVLTASPASGVTYAWSLNGGATLSTANPYTTAANAAGTYTVTVTNGNNCTATATQVIANLSGALAAGTYTVPSACGGFPTIASAVTYLNANGVTGTGDVVISVTGGYSETAPATGFALTATGTATNQIKFVKSGAGAVTINAGTGTNTPGSAVIDAMFKIVGGDYITIDGFTFTDGNTTNPATMEAGVALLKASATDGAQYNTISNNSFNMQRVNNASASGARADGSVGIAIYNTTNAASAVVTVTAASGTNSYNKLYGNTITGGNTGIALIGYAASSPFTNADFGNDVGGTSGATGNNILNFGGGGTTNAAAGVRTLAQYDLNVSYNTINNNNGSGVNHATTLRGIYLNTATSASETVTYNNVTVTCGATTSQLTAIENVAGSTAASNTVNISNNTISTVYPTATSGSTYGVYNQASAATVNINTNSIAMSTSATSGSNYAFYNSASVGTALTLNGNTITGQTFTAAGSEVFRGFYVTSLSGSGSISNNSITGVSHTGAITGEWTFVYKSASGTTETINGNTINNVTINSTGTTYLFYMSNSNSGGEIANNTVTGFSKNVSSSAAFYGFYNFSGPSGTTNLHDNTFSNITLNSSAGSIASSGQNMVYWGTGSSNTLNVYNNSFTNVTQNNASGVTQGIVSLYANSNVYGNTVSNWTSAGSLAGLAIGNSSTPNANTYNNTISGLSSSAASGFVYGAYLGTTTSGGVNALYNNKISGLTVSGATSPSVHGIYVSGGSTVNVYANKVHSLSASGAISTTSGAVNGITLAGGTTDNVYNNIIGNLTAPAASLTDAIRGINITSTSSSTTLNVSFNTIYLNASSTGTDFGTSGLFATTSTTASTATLNLRSNIIANSSAHNGAGITAAFRRSSTSLTNYGSASNNNLFYAGTASANNLLYYDGTNSDQTLANLKTRLTPRDQQSISEDPSTKFLSTTGSASDYLHIDPSIATGIESGGLTVSGITVDYDGDTRLATPDIGADEFAGTPLPCSGAIGGTITPASSSVCSTNTAVTISSVGMSTGGGISYQWMVATTSGGTLSNVTGGTGANTPSYTTPTGMAVGTYYYKLMVTCSADPENPAYSTEYAFTVKPVPTASASSNSPVCSGSALNLTGSTDIGTTYAWTGPNSFTSTSLSPSISSATPAATGTYSFTATLNGCTSTAATVAVTVNETPSALTVTPANALLCQGATQALTVSGGTLSTPIILSTETFNGTPTWTTVNSSTGGTPANAAWTLRPDGYVYTNFSSYTFHSNDNSQFYLTNSDAQGSGGSTETYLVSPSMSTTGLTAASINFYHDFKTISGSTGYLEASTDGSTWTTLATYTSAGSDANFASASVPLTAPFLNQASVYIRFKYIGSYSWWWAIDNVSLATPATAPIVWSPSTGLYTDAAGTIPYAGENLTTVYAKSNTNASFTATATNNGCSSTGTANLVVNPAPAGNMSNGSVAVCQNATSPTITFTGTTGTAPYTFTYTLNGGSPQTVSTGSGANPQSVTISVPTGTPGTFTYALTNVADIYCSAAVTGSTYSVTVNALPTVSFTGLPSSACVNGGSYTLNGSPAGGTFSGPGVTGNTFNPASAGVGGPYTITYTYSNGTCSNSYSQTVTVNAAPTVSFSGLAATYCTTDAAVTLTGTPGGGTFSGTGISGNTFDPATAGAGTYTITYSFTDGNGCSGTATQEVTVSECPTYTTLNMKMYLQGYYAGSGTMQPVMLNEGAGASSTEVDNITVEIHDGTTPSTVLATVTGMLNTDGTVSVQIPASVSGSHYIAIKHRNTIQTWSANTVNFAGGTLNYDFTTAASQAYGSNQVEVETGVFAFYTGDINQDENIDILDYPEIDTDVNNFEFGYFKTDLNGDGNVDILDYPVLDANVNNFIFSDHP
jgi:hypothetical protein